MVGGCGFWPLLPLVILVASGGRCCRRRAESTRLNRHAEPNRVAAATRFGLQEIRDDLQIVESLNVNSSDDTRSCLSVYLSCLFENSDKPGGNSAVLSGNVERRGSAGVAHSTSSAILPPFIMQAFSFVKFKNRTVFSSIFATSPSTHLPMRWT